MNTRGPSRNVRDRMISAEANSTAAVEGSSKAHIRRTKATGAEASSSAGAAAAPKTTATTKPSTAPAVRSGPNWGSERHGCNAN